MRHLLNPNNTNTPRIQTIDALRGLAALLVLIAHILLETGTGRFSNLRLVFAVFDLGQFGVSLFFVISGYIIPLSLDRLSLKTFWRRRFFRLYPAYWFSIILILLLIAANIVVPYSKQFQTSPVLMVLANITMLQMLFGFDNLIGIYWSLTYELLFYLFMSGLVFFQVARQSVKIATIIFITAFIHDVVLMRMGIALPIELSLFGLMAVGHIFFRLSQQSASSRIAMLYIVLLILLLLCTTVTLVTSLSRGIAPLVFFVLVHKQWQPRVMIWLGAISYPLYLFHELVIAVLRTGSPLLNIFIWVSGAILIAWLVHRFIEIPFQDLGRNPQKAQTHEQLSGGGN